MYWIDEFWKLFLSKDINDNKKSFSLKNKYIPKKLYRYRNISDYDALERVMNEIQSGEIYLANPETFNDPFDCASVIDRADVKGVLDTDIIKSFYQECISSDIFDNVVNSNYEWLRIVSGEYKSKQMQMTVRQVKQLYEDGISKFNRDFNDVIRSGVRISSFTESNNNIPMWYHYAADFSGVCIEYDTENTDSTMNNLLFPITYDKNFVDIYKKLRNKEIATDISIYIFVASQKLLDWNYEKEWRVIMPVSLLRYDDELFTDKSGKIHYFSKPTKVILGFKTHPVAEKLIVSCCKENNILCEKSQKTEFGLRIN